MRLFRDERGQTTIITAVSLLCLCGMAGFSVDVGALFKAKRLAQTAADAAALSGAAELPYGDASTFATAAAAKNGVTNGSNGYTLTINCPPTSGPHVPTATTTCASAKYIEVIVTQSAPTYFMRLFQLNSMNVSARAVAGNGPGSGCIFALDASGNDVGLSGSGTLNMPDCGVMVNSASNNALTLSGNSSLSALSIGVVGGYSDSSSGGLSPLPITGIAPAPDPLASLSAPTFTPSTCASDPHPNSSGTTTLNPGCYNGLSISGSGTVVLNPGLYIINGGMSSSGSASISGTGITIYLAAPNGALSLTGSGALNIAAPNCSTTPSDCTNPYNGILFFEDRNDTNVMKVAGNNGSNLQGIFYAADATLNLQGSSGAAFYADLVVSALSIAGTNNLHNYSGSNANTPLIAPRLVE